MIVLADDYVGYHVVKFLCERGEPIEVFVYDLQDRGSYNKEMIALIKVNNPNVDIYSSEEIKSAELLERIKSQKIELGILAWWPYIISQAMIESTIRGFVNTHPGFLPYNRGKHPYFWSIVDDTPFGVTLHYVDKNIDSGAVIAQKEIPITWLDTGETLYNQSREEILSLFYQHFDAIKSGNAKVFPQIQEEGTFHFGKELEPFCNIDLDKKYSARTLFNMIRGRMFRGMGAVNFSENGERYYVSISIDKENNNNTRE